MRCRILLRLAAYGVLTLLPVAMAQEYPRGFVGNIATDPTTATVGEPVSFLGSGFEPGSELELIWTTYDLDWRMGSVAGKYDGTFLGLQRSPTERALGTANVGSDGSFEATIPVPEDFGGMHDVVVRQGDVNLNKAGLFVRADMQLSPEEGPLGSDVTVTITGIDSGNPMVWYLLTYDHSITGFVSAVRNRGTAKFVIPAVGAPGPHLVRLEDSPFGHPYLPLDTSPWAHLEVPSRIFTVTDETPVLPPPPGEQQLPAVAGTEPASDGPVIWLDPWAAPVGASTTIHGKGFDSDSVVQLTMSNMAGSRVTSSGFAPVEEALMDVAVGADGTFSATFAVPDTLGGLHDIFVRPASEPEATITAETQMRVLPLALELENDKVRFGDTLMLHIKGIGWTQTENIFGISIDNTYIGYACGFSTNGDVRVPIQVSWEPGWHFIDVYPSFYRNKQYSEVDEAPFLFRQSMLSWDDHPSGFHFRFAFEVLPAETATR
ncbi:MAG: hypothetical protein R6W77_01760 [Trueperaceae bacterium]